MKEKVFELGQFNGWKGCIGLYFNQKDIRMIAKEIGIKYTAIKEMTIKEVYELYDLNA